MKDQGSGASGAGGVVLVDTVAKRQHEEYKATVYVSDRGSNRLAEK